ncbi:MAG: hypothetical protein B6I20_03625 [Bacteroidetes bacterium 4572_117]|nr:MAG: hypothetical protein B6I20_03625 [Bacteroidetes bacterium 4572_117]
MEKKITKGIYEYGISLNSRISSMILIAILMGLFLIACNDYHSRIVDIQSQNVDNINVTSVEVLATITDIGEGGISNHGWCWAISRDPTIDDDKIDLGDKNQTGGFTVTIGGLTPATTYYARPFVSFDGQTKYGEELTFTTLGFQIETIFVSGGDFQMGCTGEPDDCPSDEIPAHTVTLDGFYLSENEITNGQYADFMNKINAQANGSYDGIEYLDIDDDDCQISHNGSSFIVDVDKEDFPVIEVTWYGANGFCEFYGGRLPTEAEWEYAARGGTNYTDNYLYSGSNTIGDVAWYEGNATSTNQVGLKGVNQLGIYDMTGNVWEWCADWYSDTYYGSNPQTNPKGPSSGTVHVLRGGSWGNYAVHCLLTNRNDNYPNYSTNSYGFRLYLPD